MKSWVVFKKNAILLYYPFLLLENLTFLSSKAEMRKRKCERLPHSQFPRCSVLYLKNTFLDFLHFSFLIKWKDLRELLLVLVIFALQQKKVKKKKKAKQKRYNLIIESFLSNNKSNFFKSIKTPTSGKNPWSPSQKWSNDSYLQENQGL